jgi:hypothetical protein
MIVDWHAHVYPGSCRRRRGGGDSPLTIEKLLEAHGGLGSISASSAILCTTCEISPG